MSDPIKVPVGTHPDVAYTLGMDMAAANERANIVAWLRSRAFADGQPFTHNLNMHADMIERGEHAR